jgi:hypothetical protein
MEKDKIDVNSKNCTECMCCQLICSLTYNGEFNPEKARIVIRPPNEISFTDECIKGCILCTQYCVYGAITKVKGA